jgi:hypothetical protein
MFDEYKEEKMRTTQSIKGLIILFTFFTFTLFPGMPAANPVITV